MESNKVISYIGVVVGIISVYFLYRQYVREEKKTALEIELSTKQLALINKQS